MSRVCGWCERLQECRKNGIATEKNFRGFLQNEWLIAEGKSCPMDADNCYHCEKFGACFRKNQVIEVTGTRDTEPVYIPNANMECEIRMEKNKYV